MSGIHVGGDGVRVATTLVSRRVSWIDIDHFAVLPPGRLPYVGYVVLRDERKLESWRFRLRLNRRKGA